MIARAGVEARSEGPNLRTNRRWSGAGPAHHLPGVVRKPFSFVLE